MKTNIFPGLRAVATLARAAFLAVFVVCLLGGSLWAAPDVKTLGGGGTAESGPFYGSAYGSNWSTNTLDALFHTPMGIAANSSGELFVADRDNNAIRELTDLGGADNGSTITLLTNQIQSPVGVVLDSAGNIYVLNRGGTSPVNTNGTVLEFNQYTILIATNATHLTNAAGIAIDPYGNLYVTERTNLLIKITNNVQMTVATVTMTNAFLQGIAYMANGMIAACDYGRDGIYEINPGTGLITTNAGFNGQGDEFGVANQGYPAADASFFHPSGVAAAGDGALLVTDFGNDRVKVITAAGIVTNLYGVTSNDWDAPYFPGWVNGTVVVPDAPNGVASRCPQGITLSPDGSTVYTTEDYYHLVRMVTGSPFSPPPLPAPSAPLGLNATIVTNNGVITGVSLTWNPDSVGSDVTNYLVERANVSGGPYGILTSTPGTSYLDTSVAAGGTYYYVIQAENSGGLSAYSGQVEIAIPIPPPPAPSIGYFESEPNPTYGTAWLFNQFAAGTNNIFNNDLSMGIVANEGGVQTYYISGATPLTGNPINGANVPYSYTNLMLTQPIPLPVAAVPNLTIEAVSVNAADEESPISIATINFQCGTPVINGTNAAQFTVYDVTTNVTYYYTTDGTSPLTNTPASQIIVSTNGQPVVFSINDSSTFTNEIVAERNGYAPSAVITNIFLAQNFHGNELSWGFAQGYCSSEFIASPGETFYAPVTLTTLSAAAMYGFEFNMTVTNLGPDPVPSGNFGFSSMLKEIGTLSNYVGNVLYQIPPLMFIGDASSPPPPSQIVYYNGTNFVNLTVTNTNLNELAVGWFEVYGETNLFDSTTYNLLSFSQAFIQVIPSPAYPNNVIVGGYNFLVPTNAEPGEQYQIQLNRPSANGDGFGGPNSAVVMTLPNNGSLTNGAINATKLVTVGQPKYLAGDVYPFSWVNAGDFGNGDLTNYGANDVEITFDAAVYDFNEPQPGSDFADAMDSAGGFGAYDAAAGYWTNANVTANNAQRNALFNVNDTTTINKMAFGDGQLDICDVFVTFVRSQFPNLNWFERYYTNDPVHGVFGRIAQAVYPQTNIYTPAGELVPELQTPSGNQPVSITNTPTVHFSAGDYLASAGQTVSIPVTATVYGTNTARMLMLNVSVVALDGSPAITQPVTFTLSAPFNNSTLFNTGYSDNSYGNYAAAILPASFPIPSGAAVTGSNVIGYLHVTIPASATSSSSYALHFNHASASPNGLVSFPRTTFTGLITLSNRSSSSYNDGIPDSWRLRYFGTVYNQLSVSNADADGTGLNNYQKYLAGLNPVDPTSVLNEGTDQSVAQSPQDMVVYWPSVSGKTYIVQRSSTLFPPHWTNISTNTGDGTYMEIHDTNGGGSRFYQVTTP